MVGQYMLELKLFWKFINSVLVFSHTRIIVHCGGVRIPKQKKTLTEYTRFWKHKPNRTEIAKSKLTQPYTSAYDLLFRLALKPKFWHQPHNTDLSIGLRLDHLTSSEMKAKTVATPGLEAKTLISASSPHFDIYHLAFWPIVWIPDFGLSSASAKLLLLTLSSASRPIFCLGQGHGQNVKAEGIVTWPRPRPQDQTLALAEARMSSPRWRTVLWGQGQIQYFGLCISLGSGRGQYLGLEAEAKIVHRVHCYGHPA